jgi:VanZ family protein
LIVKIVVRVGAALALLAIGILSLVPGEDRPHTDAPGGLEHAAAYFFAGFLLGLACRRRFSAIRVVLVITAYGALLELAQLWVPGRNGQLSDVVADFAGASIGAAVAVLLARRIPKLAAAES